MTIKSDEFHLTLATSIAWDLSSAGRASALQAEGHRFEPYSGSFLFLRLHGQAVKTSPFHGGNTGSNPVGVIFSTAMR